AMNPTTRRSSAMVAGSRASCGKMPGRFVIEARDEGASGDEGAMNCAPTPADPETAVDVVGAQFIAPTASAPADLTPCGIPPGSRAPSTPPGLTADASDEPWSSAVVVTVAGRSVAVGRVEEVGQMHGAGFRAVARQPGLHLDQAARVAAHHHVGA